MPHFVITGPAVESKIWSFPDIDVFVIGRSPSCALILADPERKGRMVRTLRLGARPLEEGPPCVEKDAEHLVTLDHH